MIDPKLPVTLRSMQAALITDVPATAKKGYRHTKDDNKYPTGLVPMPLRGLLGEADWRERSPLKGHISIKDIHLEEIDFVIRRRCAQH